MKGRGTKGEVMGERRGKEKGGGRRGGKGEESRGEQEKKAYLQYIIHVHFFNPSIV